MPDSSTDTGASRILVAGVPKTGTTALVYKLAEGMDDPVLAFEPTTRYRVRELEEAELKRRREEGGALSRVQRNEKVPLIAKIVYPFHDERPLDHLLTREFVGFDAIVWIARDPRDQLVSAFLYAFFKSHNIPEHVYQIALDLTRKREQGESIPLHDIMRQCFGGGYYHHPSYYLDRITPCFREPRDDLVIFSYDDLIAKRYESLGERLGLTLAGEAHVPQVFSRVRRSGSSGEWRRWFTPEDVDHFRPILGEYMSLMGIEDDWALLDEPIDPEFASKYMEKIHTGEG